MQWGHEMWSGYRAFCTSCLWDDGYFKDEHEARTVADLHKSHENCDHEVDVEPVSGLEHQ